MDAFKINSKDDLLYALEINEDELTSILNDRSSAYKKFHIKKKKGMREIHAIIDDHPLYNLQKNLNRFLQSVLLPDSVYGFRKGKSYFDYLIPHASISESNNKFYLRLDITDFFDSISCFTVNDSLDYYISNEIDDYDRKQILEYITDIISLDDKIVQGAITSPVISNIVFRSLDIRIEKYCQKFGIVYTRYADDLLFSSGSSYIHNYKFINAIQYIISTKGFKLNLSKTLKYKNEISLNGYVVGSSVRLSRKKLHRINNILFNLNQSSFGGFTNNSKKYYTKNVLAGYRSFLIQSIRYIEDESIINRTNNKIKEIESLIMKYCK